MWFLVKTIFLRTSWAGTTESQIKNYTKKRKPHHWRGFQQQQQVKRVQNVTRSDNNNIIKW